MSIDPETRDVVQTVYIRGVERAAGALRTSIRSKPCSAMISISDIASEPIDDVEPADLNRALKCILSDDVGVSRHAVKMYQSRSRFDQHVLEFRP
jgi:hypothetical protein